MSDFDPDAYLAQKQKAAPAPKAFDPDAYLAHKTNTPDSPDEGNLFTGDVRMQNSFASPDVTQEYLAKNGYKNAHQNSNDEWVAQNDKGRWVKDTTNFFPTTTGQPGEPIGKRISKTMASAHPVEWAESHLGGALPLLGQMGGDALSALLAPETGGGSLAAAVPMSAAGAAAGQYARNKIGSWMGVNNAPATKGMLSEGLQGASAPVVGRALGEGIKGAGFLAEDQLNQVGAPLKKVVSNTLGKVVGVSPDSAWEYIKHPYETLFGKTDDGIPLRVAKEGSDALAAKNKALGKAVEVANDARAAVPGVLDTSSTLDTLSQQLQDALKKGEITPQEADTLQAKAEKYLMTPYHDPGTAKFTPIKPRENFDGLETSVPNASVQDSMTAPKRSVPGLGGKAGVTPDAEAHTQMSLPMDHGPSTYVELPGARGSHDFTAIPPDKNPLVALAPEQRTLLAHTQPPLPEPGAREIPGIPSNKVIYPREEVQQALPIKRGFEPAGEPELVPGQPGRSYKLPQTDAETLRKGIGQFSPGANGPSQAIMDKKANQIVPQGTDKYQDQQTLIRKLMKALNIADQDSPEVQAVVKANGDFNSFKKDAKILKPMQNPTAQENFVRNLEKPGKTNVLDAFKRQVSPSSLHDLQNYFKDVATRKDWSVGATPTLGDTLRNSLKSLPQRTAREGLKAATGFSAATDLPGVLATHAFGPWSLMNQPKENKNGK